MLLRSFQSWSSLRSSVQTDSLPLMETHTWTKSELRQKPESSEHLADVHNLRPYRLSGFCPLSNLLCSSVVSEEEVTSSHLSLQSYTRKASKKTINPPLSSAWAMAQSLSLSWSRVSRADLKQYSSKLVNFFGHSNQNTAGLSSLELTFDLSLITSLLLLFGLQLFHQL